MSYNNRGHRGDGPPRGRGFSARGSASSRGGSFTRGSAPGRGGGPPFRGHSGGGGNREVVIFKGDTPATVQPHLSNANMNTLISSLSPLRNQNTPDRPVRPGFGTLGTPVILRANFFAVKFRKGQKFYEYTVTMSGPKTKLPNTMKIRLFELLEQHPDFAQYNRHIAHDRSAKLYSAKPLPQPLECDIKYFDDHKEGPDDNADEYKLEIEFTKEHDLSALNDYLNGNPESKGLDIQPLTTALNLIGGKFASGRGTRVGRSILKYFDQTTRPYELSHQIEARQGFSLSFRPGYQQFMVNVNVCMAAFVTPGNLADKLNKFQDRSHGAMLTLPRGLVKSIKIKTTHLGYKKSVFQIMTTSARQTTFTLDNGKKITVEKYFEQTYNKKLKYPDTLPVINVGNKRKPNYLPAELCEIIPGCVFRDRLSAMETKNMMNVACNPPHENAQAITQTGFPFLGFSNEQGNNNNTNSPLEPFGISIDPEMVVIPSRELGPPTILGNKPITNVNKASWYFANGVNFVRGATIRTWQVLSIQDGRYRTDFNEAMGTVDQFSKKLERCGVKVLAKPNVKEIELVDPRGDDASRSKSVQKIREGLIGAKNASFVLVLLRNVDKVVYAAVKTIGDVELGVHTVCMQVDTALKRGEAYFANVALKLNIKLGGINHKLDGHSTKWLTKKSTMMVGIDVTHAGPTSRYGTPSIAAVVANVDDSFVQFPASMRIQAVDEDKEAKEMVTDLAEMMCERLSAYEKKMKKLPERVFIFRDGVSEGQFDVSLREEKPLILEAFKRMKAPGGKAYRPKLSIIICGKRHHARFFATNSQYASQNGNTRPGTIVDKGISAIFDFDFYLQPHDGIKGSVKATHYTVIYDENSFSADEIQKGTHDFSYLYARATKAVSLMPPAYYADLACERGRCYLNDLLALGDGKSSSGASTSTGGKKGRKDEKEEVFRAAAETWGDGIHPNMRDSMFYI
ncbi:argonaute-like protein [Agaricus bisporus var. bisporus H97]|uniref:argonaute-like protein n=1 Tax=Agaricus bisporus var. bisporus (strain H97 / ATCC MYA-4626 / FGSC 10389) TaxID=936046 RepID=UPI00029F66AD|nr:argonaute-like protein [Agaricus bisporus var. bisporus H97]EKV42269.1 argonaute-like protein [Agaricus bisporus var. bisporus H97]